MKTCPKCKQELEFSAFAKSASKGYQSYCRQCNKDNKMQWLQDNRDKANINNLWTRYRLREADVNAMLLKQNSKCGLCLETFTGTPRVDHDHACCPGRTSCGKCVRGLLCDSCNKSLGSYERVLTLPGLNQYLVPLV